MRCKLINFWPGSELKEFDCNSHPLQVCLMLRQRYPDIIFEFSRYRYIPQQILDPRVVFNASGADVNTLFLASSLEKLEPGEELALNSRVIVRGRTQHIPMIDFVTDVFDKHLYETLRNYLARTVMKELMVYESGRSFHAYSLSLVSPRAFTHHLARCLLANLPNRPPIVDTRWIGHRLLAGYASLRWSCNSMQHIRYPKIVDLLQISKSVTCE
jgi:hypothetical protein